MTELFDTRLYRTIGIFRQKNSLTCDSYLHTPYASDKLNTYVGDYFESPGSVKEGLEFEDPGNSSEASDDTKREYQKKNQLLDERKAAIQAFINMPENQEKNMGVFSAIHPYALLKLTGAAGKKSVAEGNYLIDSRYRRRWYEIDSDASGGYAKNPSTSVLINWANQDPYGRTPYSFQDFVFCKYWNKIQNNRMITLRRYSTPVRDSLDMYTDSSGNLYQQAMAPVATAVTYFGEGTGNSLSDMMNFSVGYNWKEFEGKVWEATSSQNNEGQALAMPSNTYMSNGLRVLTQTLGFIDDMKYQQTQGKEGDLLDPLNAKGAPPDPYRNGPYENRIIGPVNVINKVWGRDRGLKFTQDGLKVVFEYVSRPVANINNKAIMLDLLANMLMMTSSSGTFFGGVNRYWTNNPAMYPWKDTDTLNRLYKGQLFGKKSVYTGLINTAYKEPSNFFVNFAKDLFQDIKSAASSVIDKILGKPEDSQTDDSSTKDSSYGTSKNLLNTLSRMVSGHMLKGASIPWITGMRSILTGEPTGEWHLTIGNPLNPIAMIGNLIVDDAAFEFSNELGPDDFPISFKCTVNLKHALGRDKEGVESMFNRGYGRIYTLPTNYKTSADSESTVDDATGNNNPLAGKMKWGMTYSLATSGNNYAIGALTAEKRSTLQNSGTIWDGAMKNYTLDPVTLGSNLERWNPGYILLPNQAHWVL